MFENYSWYDTETILVTVQEKGADEAVTYTINTDELE